MRPERHAGGDTVLTTLRAVRKELGLTQQAMARLFGVKRSTYANWECGLRRVRPDMMLRIAIALGIPAEELFRDLVPVPVSRQRQAKEGGKS